MSWRMLWGIDRRQPHAPGDFFTRTELFNSTAWLGPRAHADRARGIGRRRGTLSAERLAGGAELLRGLYDAGCHRRLGDLAPRARVSARIRELVWCSRRLTRPKLLSFLEPIGPDCWVPLGATGAAFCPSLAALGHCNFLKSLIGQGRTANSHAGGHRFETGRSHFQINNLARRFAEPLLIFGAGCHWVPRQKRSFGVRMYNACGSVDSANRLSRLPRPLN